MKRSRPEPPTGAEVLQAGGRGQTGNLLYFFPSEQPPLVLKVYCFRRSRWREFWKDVSERVFEGKRGATAATRCATERLILALWAREGFDVIRLVARPLPSGMEKPALWLEYCAAPVLAKVLTDPSRPPGEKLVWVELLGQALSRRHRRALELNDPRLVHEHGQIKHFFAQDKRLIAFDLEHGYRSGYPVVRAIGRELTGIADSLVRADGGGGEEFLRALMRGYANPPLVRAAAREATQRGGLAGIIRRLLGHLRGGKTDKTQVMARLVRLLEPEAGSPASARG